MNGINKELNYFRKKFPVGSKGLYGVNKVVTVTDHYFSEPYGHILITATDISGRNIMVDPYNLKTAKESMDYLQNSINGFTELLRQLDS